MVILNIITLMIWLMLPAYLSNPAAAICAKIGKPGLPIDFNKTYNSKRIFGDGKTFKGFLSGVVFGIFFGICENLINKYLFNNYMPNFTYIVLLTLPLGAMLGDLTASFFKRRIGLARGEALPFIDQLDFVFGAWIITLIFARSWFLHYFTIKIMLSCILLTPIFHRIVNIVGYKMGISKEPW